MKNSMHKRNVCGRIAPQLFFRVYYTVSEHKHLSGTTGNLQIEISGHPLYPNKYLHITHYPLWMTG
jgi:hypothetical protein